MRCSVWLEWMRRIKPIPNDLDLRKGSTEILGNRLRAEQHLFPQRSLPSHQLHARMLDFVEHVLQQRKLKWRFPIKIQVEFAEGDVFDHAGKNMFQVIFFNLKAVSPSLPDRLPGSIFSAIRMTSSPSDRSERVEWRGIGMSSPMAFLMDRKKPVVCRRGCLKTNRINNDTWMAISE